MGIKLFTFIIYYKQDADGYFMYDPQAAYKKRQYIKTNIKSLEGLKSHLKPSLKGLSVRYLKGK